MSPRRLSPTLVALLPLLLFITLAPRGAPAQVPSLIVCNATTPAPLVAAYCPQASAVLTSATGLGARGARIRVPVTLPDRAYSGALWLIFRNAATGAQVSAVLAGYVVRGAAFTVNFGTATLPSGAVAVIGEWWGAYDSAVLNSAYGMSEFANSEALVTVHVRYTHVNTTAYGWPLTNVASLGNARYTFDAQNRTRCGAALAGYACTGGLCCSSAACECGGAPVFTTYRRTEVLPAVEMQVGAPIQLSTRLDATFAAPRANANVNSSFQLRLVTPLTGFSAGELELYRNGLPFARRDIVVANHTETINLANLGAAWNAGSMADGSYEFIFRARPTTLPPADPTPSTSLLLRVDRVALPATLSCDSTAPAFRAILTCTAGFPDGAGWFSFELWNGTRLVDRRETTTTWGHPWATLQWDTGTPFGALGFSGAYDGALQVRACYRDEAWNAAACANAPIVLAGYEWSFGARLVRAEANSTHPAIVEVVSETVELIPHTPIYSEYAEQLSGPTPGARLVFAPLGGGPYVNYTIGAAVGNVTFGGSAGQFASTLANGVYDVTLYSRGLGRAVERSVFLGRVVVELGLRLGALALNGPQPLVLGTTFTLTHDAVETVSDCVMRFYDLVNSSLWRERLVVPFPSDRVTLTVGEVAAGGNASNANDAALRVHDSWAATLDCGAPGRTIRARSYPIGLLLRGLDTIATLAPRIVSASGVLGTGAVLSVAYTVPDPELPGRALVELEVRDASNDTLLLRTRRSGSTSGAFLLPIGSPVVPEAAYVSPAWPTLNASVTLLLHYTALGLQGGPLNATIASPATLFYPLAPYAQCGSPAVRYLCSAPGTPYFCCKTPECLCGGAGPQFQNSTVGNRTVPFATTRYTHAESVVVRARELDLRIAEPAAGAAVSGSLSIVVQTGEGALAGVRIGLLNGNGDVVASRTVPDVSYSERLDTRALPVAWGASSLPDGSYTLVFTARSAHDGLAPETLGSFSDARAARVPIVVDRTTLAPTLSCNASALAFRSALSCLAVIPENASLTYFDLLANTSALDTRALPEMGAGAPGARALLWAVGEPFGGAGHTGAVRGVLRVRVCYSDALGNALSCATSAAIAVDAAYEPFNATVLRSNATDSEPAVVRVQMEPSLTARLRFVDRVSGVAREEAVNATRGELRFGGGAQGVFARGVPDGSYNVTLLSRAEGRMETTSAFLGVVLIDTVTRMGAISVVGVQPFGVGTTASITYAQLEPVRDCTLAFVDGAGSTRVSVPFGGNQLTWTVGAPLANAVGRDANDTKFAVTESWSATLTCTDRYGNARNSSAPVAVEFEDFARSLPPRVLAPARARSYGRADSFTLTVELPTQPAAGSVALYLRGDGASYRIGLGVAERYFSFPVPLSFGQQTLTPQITAPIAAGTRIADGVYVVDLCYRDALGARGSCGSVEDVRIDTRADAPSVDVLPSGVAIASESSIVVNPEHPPRFNVTVWDRAAFGGFALVFRKADAVVTVQLRIVGAIGEPWVVEVPVGAEPYDASGPAYFVSRRLDSDGLYNVSVEFEDALGNALPARQLATRVRVDTATVAPRLSLPLSGQEFEFGARIEVQYLLVPSGFEYLGEENNRLPLGVAVLLFTNEETGVVRRYPIVLARSPRFTFNPLDTDQTFVGGFGGGGALANGVYNVTLWVQDARGNTPRTATSRGVVVRATADGEVVQDLETEAPLVTVTSTPPMGGLYAHGSTLSIAIELPEQATRGSEVLRLSTSAGGVLLSCPMSTRTLTWVIGLPIPLDCAPGYPAENYVGRVSGAFFFTFEYRDLAFNSPGGAASAVFALSGVPREDVVSPPIFRPPTSANGTYTVVADMLDFDEGGRLNVTSGARWRREVAQERVVSFQIVTSGSHSYLDDAGGELFDTNGTYPITFSAFVRGVLVSSTTHVRLEARALPPPPLASDDGEGGGTLSTAATVGVGVGVVGGVAGVFFGFYLVRAYCASGVRA